MKGIYLHGYQGYVTDEKREFLKNFGDVYAPQIDYDQNPTIVLDLINQFREESLDFVSGTSLGGILAYHLALYLNVPCLILNPAVTAKELIKDYLPKESYGKYPEVFVQVVIGEQDDIVNPKLQVEFFNQFIDENQFIKIKKYDELGHFVPLDVFTESFNQFRNDLK